MTVIEAVCQITLDRPMPIKEGVQQIPMFRSYVDRARSQSTTNGLRNPFDWASNYFTTVAACISRRAAVTSNSSKQVSVRSNQRASTPIFSSKICYTRNSIPNRSTETYPRINDARNTVYIP